ncbi:MAG: ComEC/Rec2 family competence protein [Bellilinea sp.]
MPLLWLSAAALSGIALGALLRLPPVFWLAGGLLAALLALVERRAPPGWRAYARLRRRLPLPLGVLIAALLLGGLRWSLAQPAFDPGDLASYNDLGKAELSGWIAADPDRRESATLLTVQVESLRPAGGGDALAVSGKALLRLPAGGDWRYGQRVRVWGAPLTPPHEADFSYRDYLARRGIYTYLMYPAVEALPGQRGSPLMSAIYDLRRHAYATLNRIFPQPEAALLAGILLGLERDLPADLARAFQDTGTAHIIAISGFNMTVLSALFLTLFGRLLPRGWAALCAVTAISFYTLLVGANPAVVRAALMGGLAVFGRLVGRSSAGLTPLAFSAAVMCLFNPLLPWDASFQLSFTATLGLIVYAEPLQRGFEGWAARRLPPLWARRLSAPVSEYVLFTLAAQVTTLPVVLALFGRLSLSALLANPLVLPVQPLVMQLSGLALLAGMIFAPLGQVLGWLAYPFAAYTLRVVEGIAALPGGVLELGAIGGGFALGAYALLFGLTALARQPGRLKPLLKPAALLAGAGLVCLLTWEGALRRPDGRLHLVLLPLPEGSATLVRAPGGSQVLIGSAPHANNLAGALGREAGLFRRWLDGVVIPTRRAAQLEGLPAALERLPARSACWAVEPPGGRIGSRIADSLARSGANTLRLGGGQTLQLDEGVHLRVVAQDGERAALLLTYGNLRVLLPNGIPAATLRRVQPPLHGALLLLAADDLKESPLADWQAFEPPLVLQHGSPPDFGWLSPPDGAGVVSTARHGRIELISDGQQVWLSGARK